MTIILCRNERIPAGRAVLLKYAIYIFSGDSRATFVRENHEPAARKHAISSMAG